MHCNRPCVTDSTLTVKCVPDHYEQILSEHALSLYIPRTNICCMGLMIVTLHNLAYSHFCASQHQEIAGVCIDPPNAGKNSCNLLDPLKIGKFTCRSNCKIGHVKSRPELMLQCCTNKGNSEETCCIWMKEVKWLLAKLMLPQNKMILAHACKSLWSRGLPHAAIMVYTPI